jgi:hypothetical protein
MNRKRKSDTARKCLSLLKGWTFFQFCTHVLPLISTYNWEYIVFYSYYNLENIKRFTNSNNSIDTHAPPANTSKP